jgi:PDZ domain-containing protein
VRLPRRARFLAGALLAAALVAVGVLYLVPSDTYIFLPDPAHPVAPLVKIPGHQVRRDTRGGIYFVDVFVRKATLLEKLFGGLHEGAALHSPADVQPPGVSEKAQHTTDLREMARSQDIAAAVALRALGYKVKAQPHGALVQQIGRGAPADGKLEPTDVIVAVDGKPVRTPADLRRLIGLHKPGERVRISFKRGASLHQVRLKTIADPRQPKHPLIGVVVSQSATIELPFPVVINSGNVGGPSAGLAFALDVMEELGRDVDGGHKIAATGEIELGGGVLPIGGVEQKTIGARRAHVDAFLVPAGDNAREARRYAHGLRIIPVTSFQQALRALATLPKAA